MKSRIIYANEPQENEKEALQVLESKLPKENYIIIAGAIVPSRGFIQDREFDVILICPKGVFNIEMKRYYGKILTKINNYNKTLQTVTINGDSGSVDNPIPQASDQSKVLSSQLKRQLRRNPVRHLKVEPVVLFSVTKDQIEFEVDEQSTSVPIFTLSDIHTLWATREDKYTVLDVNKIVQSFNIKEVSPETTKKNEKIGSYVKEKLLFNYGPYSVYKVRDEFDTEYFLKAHQLDPKLKEEERETFTNITKRDTKVRAKLRNNPYVLYYHAPPFAFGDYVCSTTLWVEHLSFKDLLKKKLSIEEKIAILKELFQAIQSIHNNGVYHRDLHPRNILYTKDNELKIINFDFSRIVGDPTIYQGIEVDKESMYVAPELKSDSTEVDVDYHTDYYSFGILAYELLAGKLPYRSMVDLKHEELAELHPEISEELSFSIEQLIKFNQKERDLGWKFLKEEWGK